MTPLGEHVVEQDGVDPAEHQIGERMDVVFVGERLEAVLLLRAQEDLIGDRAAERRDLAAAQIGQRMHPAGVGVADAEDFAELVVRHRHRQRCAAGRRVLDAAHADVGVAADDALVDRFEADVDELGTSAERAREQLRDLDVEPDQPIRMRGIGFDKRRATLRVSSPFQRRLRRRGCRRQGNASGNGNDNAPHHTTPGH
jgi:hypothetical protein